MSFLIYDIFFLAAFALFVFAFLYFNRKNISRDGLLILYRAGWGIKLINKIGNKYKKTLAVLEYASIATGYFLTIAMFYLLGRIVYLYIAFPAVARQLKIPPITPLIPYLPQVFKLDFLPPFYFTYWIVIIAIVAISHEFAHGIFAAYGKVKIKSTGFGFFPFFLPVFLAAFVELDEKQMSKKKIRNQLATLSAGTFANTIVAILFFAILIIFFFTAFTPAGVVYDAYPYAYANVSGISSINGIAVTNHSYENILKIANSTGLNKIKISGFDFVATKTNLEQQKSNDGSIMVYYDSPAIEAGIERIILKIDGEKVLSVNDIEKDLLQHSPGDSVTLTLLNSDGESYNRDIILGKNPGNSSKPWLGIGFSEAQSSGLMAKIYSLLSFRDIHTYYQPNFGGGTFIYNLLWWLAVISISVALVNMLPVGIFDGGRFFYLTILALTKNETKAKTFFKISTYLILGIFLLLTLVWIFYVF